MEWLDHDGAGVPEKRLFTDTGKAVVRMYKSFTVWRVWTRSNRLVCSGSTSPDEVALAQERVEHCIVLTIGAEPTSEVT